MMLDFSMFPIGKKESLSEDVALVISIIKKSNLPYELRDMGTTIEGSVEDCFNLVKKCLEKLAENNSRISCSIKIDYRKKKGPYLGKKAQKIHSILNKKNN